MKLYIKKLESIINNILEKEIKILDFVGVFLSIIFLRVFIEEFLAKAKPLSSYELIIEYIHNINFFLITLVLIWLLVAALLNINPRKLANLFMLSSILILFPPLFDMLLTGGGVFWSFYLISSWSDLGKQFITVFGHLPSGIMYFGTKIVFLSAIIFLATVIGIKTKSALRTILGAFGTYLILFIMGSFPSLFSYIYYVLLGFKIHDIHSFQIIQLFARPQNVWGINFSDLGFAFPYKLNLLYFPILMLVLTIFFWSINSKKFLAVLKNFRYPQIIYHSGLFILGMGLGILNYPLSRDQLTFSQDNSFLFFSLLASFTLLISIWLAWKASVVVNDLEDFEIDAISNPDRPLQKKIFSPEDYRQFGVICFLLSLFGALSVGFKFFVLILVYQIVAWFYSSAPFRLKKYLGLATFISSLASLMILFMGYILISPDQSIYSLSGRIIFLLLITYTLSIPIKDFKDREGDKKEGIYTVPVVFGENKGKLLVATNLFICFILSVFFLNESHLFIWALLFGAISFLVVNNGKINPRRLPWWILGIVSVYCLILIKVVFLR